MATAYSTASKRAAIYTRVSTTGQKDNFSLPGQLVVCRQYAAAHSFTVIVEYQEVASGATLDRPKLDELRNLIKQREIDALIVVCVDRLSRNQANYYLLKSELRKSSVELHYVDKGGETIDDRQGTSSDGIDVLLAEVEHARIIERMQRGKYDKLATGKAFGHGAAIYGYAWQGHNRDRTLVIDEATAAIVVKMAAWALQGLSTAAIAKRLTEYDVPTPGNSNAWHRNTVYRILTNPTIAGTLYHNRTARQKGKGKPTIKRAKTEWIAVPVPAIIDVATFEEIQVKLSENKKRNKHNPNLFYLLSRRICCTCGASFVSTVSHGVRYYRCNASSSNPLKPCEPMRTINANVLETRVWTWLQEALTSENLQIGLARQQDTSVERQRKYEEQFTLLSQRRTEIDTQLDRLLDAYLANAFDIEKLNERRSMLDIAKSSIDRELAELELKMRSIGPSIDEVEALMLLTSELHNELAHLDAIERRHIIDMLDLRVALEKVGKGKYIAHLRCILAGDNMDIQIVVP